MKNILIISTYFSPMGGVGTVRMRKYVKYLNCYDWNPTVVTVSEKHLRNIDNDLMKEIPENVKIHRIDFEAKHSDISFDFYQSLKKQINSIIMEKEYSCVLVTGGPFYIIPIAKYIYKKYKIPYVIDLRDPWKLQYIDDSSLISKIKGNIKKIIKGFIEKSCFKYASAICTVNDTMTEQYKHEYKKYAKKFFTISNGFDLDDYNDIKPKKNNGLNIVYAGKFETSAGFRDPTFFFNTLSEYNKKNKIKVNFIHIGEPENRVKRIVEEAGCEKYCKFIGFKNFNETISYCKGSDILLIICGHQKIEQTGKIFDYICCNKPIIVISTGESELDKVCQKFNNIYQVKHEDTKGLLKAIDLIISNKNPMVSNDLENSEYSRYILTGKLVDIINKLGE